MAKNLLGSILGALLKTAAGTPKKKTTRTTASNAAGSNAGQGASAKPKSATALYEGMSPKMKKQAEEVWNKPTKLPKGWETTKSETIYSSK